MLVIFASDQICGIEGAPLCSLWARPRSAESNTSVTISRQPGAQSASVRKEEFVKLGKDAFICAETFI